MLATLDYIAETALIEVSRIQRETFAMTNDEMQKQATKTQNAIANWRYAMRMKQYDKAKKYAAIALEAVKEIDWHTPSE